MTKAYLKPVDVNALMRKKGEFSNFEVHPTWVGYEYDFGGTTFGGQPDTRKWQLDLQHLLDACIYYKVIMAYDWNGGTVTEWKGRDDDRDTDLVEWVEWFVQNGKAKTIKKVLKLATLNELASRKEIMDSIE